MMNKKSVTRLFSRVLSLILVFLMYVSIFPVPISTKAANEQTDRIIVSLGDSFSSGEGIEPFYNQDLPNEQKINNEDWIAHRSKKAWSGKLTLNDNNNGICYLMNLSKYDKNQPDKEAHWYFVASSGAVISDFYNTQRPDYHLSNKLSGEGKVEPQTNIFTVLDRQNKKADYVTLTIGGNDLGFTEVVTKAAKSSAYLKPEELSGLLNKKIEQLNKTTANKLKDVYVDLCDKSGEQANIIVAGYPKLFSSSDSLDSALFSYEERKSINDAVTLFNKKISNIVAECQTEGKPVHFVPVEDAFKGHEAYTSDEYINPVKFFPRDQDLNQKKFDGIIPTTSSYSMHPNEKGAEAYARCVQAKIDELEKRDTTDSSSAIIPIETTKPNTTKPNNSPILTTSPGLIPNQKDFPGTGNWQTAAVDLICNAPNYGFEVHELDTLAIELLDITNDNIPEIFFAGQMGTASIGNVSYYFYFNGSKYVKGTMTGDIGNFPIHPHKNNSSQPVFLTHFIDDDQLSDDLPFKLENWYNDLMVSQVTASGTKLNFTKIADYTKDLEAIFTRYNGNEENPQVQEIWNKFRDDATQFKTTYPYDFYHSYTVEYLYPITDYSGSYTYNVDIDDAEAIVDAYVNSI